MNRCLSCKAQTSNERCTHPCLRTLIVCRQHARVKRPRLWHEVNQWVLDGLIRVQSAWRGYSIRNRLALAGPGVLRRAVCHNDDELTTCISKTRQHPLDYFSIEDQGRIYWFDQRSMLQWAHTHQNATNPYTRQPLSSSDLRRLRELSHKRALFKRPLYHSASMIPHTIPERRDMRWLRVCQVLQEHGIRALRFEHFASMDALQIEYFLSFLREDVRWWMAHSSGQRRKYYVWLSTFRLWSYRDELQMNCDLAGIVLAILMDLKQNRPLVDFLRSAYDRTDLMVAAGV